MKFSLHVQTRITDWEIVKYLEDLGYDACFGRSHLDRPVRRDNAVNLLAPGRCDGCEPNHQGHQVGRMERRRHVSLPHVPKMSVNRRRKIANHGTRLAYPVATWERRGP